jgi:hypothetical protein
MWKIPIKETILLEEVVEGKAFEAAHCRLSSPRIPGDLPIMISLMPPS